MTTELQLSTLVVLDTDGAIAELITAFFKPRGFNILSYTDATTALWAAIEDGDNWGVIITDFHFTQMNHEEFKNEIHRLHPKLPFIYINEPERVDCAKKAVDAGILEIVHTPIHFPQLQLAINRALHVHELKQDLNFLRQLTKNKGNIDSHIIGSSPAFAHAMDIAKRVAKSTANIFITGESGTGKEVFAKFIHDQSTRRQGKFVAINCSALPENLLESELFGHAKGAFTGALTKHTGLFEEAQDGTLFLDEIGDLTLGLQAKLLRALQEREIKRVGENLPVPINCRIISATHKNLNKEIHDHTFREDLFFRLNVIPINLPALRERREDILPLAEFFLKRFAAQNNSPARSFARDAMDFMLDNPWRGNVRELENSIERAAVLCSEKRISAGDLIPNGNLGASLTKSPPGASPDSDYFMILATSPMPTLDEVSNRYVEFAIKRNKGARDKTAKEIGIDRKTLYKRSRAEAPLFEH